MIPELRTGRLLLRGFREEDLDAFAAMQADPEAMRHIGAGGVRDRAETWRNMAMLSGQWLLKGHGVWAVECEGRFAGRVGWLEPEGWPGPELAYALAREFWGRGLAEEAARAALAWGRARWGSQQRLISLIRPENTASLALAARLGARGAAVREILGRAAEEWVYPGSQGGA